MGDSGPMLVGLVLAAAATTASSQAVSAVARPEGRAAALPAADPAAGGAGGCRSFDLMLAVLRRPAPAASRRSRRTRNTCTTGLMDLGHSHRRAVLLLYFWSAVLAFGAVAMAVSSGPWLVLAVVAALLAAGVLVTAVPRLRSARPG